MYAARDKDGMLVMYRSEPYACTQSGRWVSDSLEMVLPKDLMPELTFEMGPVKVEFVIKNN